MDNQAFAVAVASPAPAAAAGTVLRPLRGDVTVAVPPRTQTQRAKVLAALGRIASIAVTGPVNEDGHTVYVMTIALISSLPSTLEPKETVGSLAGSQRQIQTKRSFREFTNLRREMFYHADAGHRDDVKNTCKFCLGTTKFLSDSPTLPRLWNRFFTNAESLREQLESFLNLTLQIATKATVHNTRWCEDEEMVPLLVKKFLLGDAGEEDLSDLEHRNNTNNYNALMGWGGAI